MWLTFLWNPSRRGLSRTFLHQASHERKDQALATTTQTTTTLQLLKYYYYNYYYYKHQASHKHMQPTGVLELGSQGCQMPPGNLPGVKHSILTPTDLLERNIFWYTPTWNLHYNDIYYILKLGLGLFFFVIIYNRLVDSSKCDIHDFEAPVKK